jgi:cytochrome P450 family 628
MRDKHVHDKRRRVAWERAFSTKALRGYDATVVRHADELKGAISKYEGKPVNVSKWFNYFTADTISALGFGEPFNMLKDGKDHWTITLLQDGSKHLAALGPIPWILTLLNNFPWLQAANLRANKWTVAQVAKRKERKVEEGVDILHWLLNPLEKMSDDPKEEQKWLEADARLAIVAGTDTSTAALSYLFLELCKNPAITKEIRKELFDHGVEEEFSVHELQNCKYLNSVVDETLRLHPPVPDGVYRLTPPDGLQVGEAFIPGNVTIINPIYTIQRSAVSYVKPEEFIPERWTSQPELILNRKAFTPFGIGSYGCVGKQLALNEIRTVVAKLVLDFDVKFSDGEDGRRILEDTKDYFVLGLGDLDLCFIEREKGKGEGEQ